MYSTPFSQGSVVLDALLDGEALKRWENAHAAPEFSSTPSLPVWKAGAWAGPFDPETWAAVEGNRGECVAAHWYRQITPEQAMAWHRDDDYFHHPVWCLWIALEAVGPENGGLQFEERSIRLSSGQAIEFPGTLLHRTTPISAPIRRSGLVLHFR